MKFVTTLLFAASLAVSSATVLAQGAAAKADLAKGEASFAAVCAACHAADGNSIIPENPKLAQQHPEYIVKQLQEFKGLKRENAIMNGMAAALSDEDMRNIAYWLATKKAAPAGSEDKEMIALGEKIYRGGVLDRNIPACAGCHGPTAAGIPSQYPRLRGQFPGYAESQLLAFRSGLRKNNLQMTEVSAKLNDKEIKAVSAYVASLQ